MKALKSFLLTALALCFAFCVFSFVGCKKPDDGGEVKPEHTHTASATYESNATEHWKKCTGEDCDEKLEVGTHTFGEWATVKTATCTEKGSEERACTVCGYKESKDTDALGHLAGTEWKNDENKHWHECVREGCGVKLEEADHDFGEWQIEQEPTCTEKGKGAAECNSCGYKHDGDIDALDHDYKYAPAADGENHIGTCTRDSSHTVTEPHVYGEGFEFDEDNHYKTCTVCGYKNAAAHEFDFNEETSELECECGYKKAAIEKTVWADEEHGYGFILNHGVENVAAELGNQQIGAEYYEIDLGREYAGEIWRFEYLGTDLVRVTAEGNGVVRIPSEYFDAETVGDAEFKALIVSEEDAYVLTVKVTFVTGVIKTTDDFQNTFRDQKNKPAVYGYFVLGNDLDYEGNALPNHSGGLSYGMLWNCNGFKGTFDGRGYSIKNLNTANPFGLFVRIAPANGTVIKNLVFDDLVHDGGYGANIFGWATGYVRFDNITINVKRSVVADGVTFEGAPNAGITGVGFFFNLYADKNTYNNITINAEGQKIYSLLGSNVKVPDSGVISCNNFVVNAKNVYYIGKIDGGDAIPADTEINGLTLNLTSAGEVVKDVYERENVPFEIDLGVENVAVELAQQTVASGNATIAVGEGYGVLSSLTFNGNEVIGATYDAGVLTVPMSLFAATDVGEKVFTMYSESEGKEYELSIHVIIATKVIKTTDEFQDTFRDQKNKPAVYGYFVLGNDLDYEGKALPNHSGGLSYGMLWSCNGFKGTFDGRGYSIKNFNTENPFGLFVRIAPANGSVIKNLVFDDLVHEGGYGANIFGWATGYVTFDNITINVKTSVAADGVTFEGTPNAGITGVGFFFNLYADKNTYNNITINAEGQEIYSLFGSNVKVPDSGVISCKNFVINAKKVYNIGKIENGNVISADTEISGLTINQGR